MKKISNCIISGNTKNLVSKFILKNKQQLNSIKIPKFNFSNVAINDNFSSSSCNDKNCEYKNPFKNFTKIDFVNKSYRNRKNLNLNNISSKYFSSAKHVDKEGFPIPEKRDIYDEDDMIINIGEKEKFKGMLIICPTPLGNINDISIRQFEAMKNGDILACEDSRKTGKLLEFIQLKKMKEKFYAEFGISFEEFVNMGGLNMTDEQISSKIFKKENSPNEDLNNNPNVENKNQNPAKEENIKENSVFYEDIINNENNNKETLNDKSNENSIYNNQEKNDYNKTNIFDDKISFDTFYQTKEDNNKLKSMRSKHDTQEKINPKQNENFKKAQELLKDNPNKEVINEIFQRVARNKKEINSLDNIFTEVDLNLKGKSHLNKEDILSSIKLEEPIDKEYYSYVKDGNDFRKRKIAIENSDEILKIIIDPLAEKYDKEFKLSYKLRNKARFLMGMSKKFENQKNNSKDSDTEIMNEQERQEFQENLEEEITLNSGIDDDMIGMFKQRIKEEKQKKGRGLLIPFNQENEEKKIPKLIKAMKLGLRVVLLSDSGTPTISDPGYKLVKEAAKNGIVIEPLPGPSAVITGLSACALPTDKFMFYGYLPKNANEKMEKLEEIKQIGVTSVVFESPMRLQSTLNILTEIYGESHEIYIGFELTKRYENHFHGTIKNVKRDLIKHFMDKAKVNAMPYIDEAAIFKDEEINIKGEITMVLGPIKKTREEYLEEKNLRESINLDILEFTKRLDKYMNLHESQIRDILMKVCEIPKVKATKVINTVKNRKSKTRETFEMMTNKNLDSLRVPDVSKSKTGMLEEKEKKNPSVKNIKSISFK